MGIITDKAQGISLLTSGLVFDIGQGQPHRELHQQALALLLQVNELEQLVQQSEHKSAPKVLTESEQRTHEIKKVKRKLLRWSQNPEQINSRLLTHFLTLKQQGLEPITKQKMEQFADSEGIKNFNSNIFGMSHIGPKNHGKVFDIEDQIITIWPAVVDEVATFEQTLTPSAPKEEVHKAIEVSTNNPAESMMSPPPQATSKAASPTEEINESDIEAIYLSFKNLWLKRVERTAALDQLEMLGVERTLASNHIESLELMMHGKPYTTPLKETVLRYFIDHIRNDFSRGYLSRVTTAINSHLDQQESLGNLHNDIRQLVALYR